MTISSPVGTVTTYTCDADPEWFAAVVAKYGLGGGNGDETAVVKG